MESQSIDPKISEIESSYLLPYPVLASTENHGEGLSYSTMSLSSQPTVSSLDPGPELSTAISGTNDQMAIKTFGNNTLLNEQVKVEVPQIDSSFEDLCCIGFNPKTMLFTAVINVKKAIGYVGNTCTEGTIESVGFWLEEPSWTESAPSQWNAPNVKFIGESRVRVFDIPRIINPPLGWLRYSVSVRLNFEMLQYIKRCGDPSGPRLPRLQCVLGFGQVIGPNNFQGKNVARGAVLQAAIQFPIS
ncbi:MAG: hypothetical protein ABI876_06850 [Bacteroidota bacterium]